MNKILVSNEKNMDILSGSKYVFTESGSFFLEIEDLEKDVFLVASKNTKVVLNILGKKSKLNIYLQILENAEIDLNYLLIEGTMNLKVNLIEYNSTLNLNYSLLNSINSTNKIEIRHSASKTASYLKNHGFSKNHANLIFDVSAYIDKGAKKCISKQDNQIIENENSMSQINPNLYIDNYDVDASHSAYVGEFKEQELFYLMSRGLDSETSKFLLLKSFLIGSFNLEDEIQEKFCHEIIKYFNKEV